MQRHQTLFDQEMRLHDQFVLAQHFEEFQAYVENDEKATADQRARIAALEKRAAG